MDDAELFKRCHAFIEQQACGEWTDTIVYEDAAKLFSFVKSVTLPILGELKSQIPDTRP